MAQKQAMFDSPESRQYPVRSPSTASDITSRSINSSVPQATLAPAYVAQTAASELIASEIEKPVLVSSSALILVNEFLDQVLYNIIVTSRSTSLSSLKAAVPTVLKPRLGKAALRVAQEELKEYLNEEEEVELQSGSNAAELKHDFDPDLAWRLARLRCMVYTRLGDLEEEDEEEWLEREGLHAQRRTARSPSQTALDIGPASAIFLTSIIEYLGEQALYYAAQHAQKRHYQNSRQLRSEGFAHSSQAQTQDQIIVDGRDMSHIGRDSPLSRLWRSYRRNTRESNSQQMSPESRAALGLAISHSRTPGSIPYEETIAEESRSPDQIPLPMSGNDINEIEVPGLAPAFSDDEEDEFPEDTPKKRRPASMIEMPGTFPEWLDMPEPSPPEIPERNPARPTWLRKRSVSSPIQTLGNPKKALFPRDSHNESPAYFRTRSDDTIERRRPSLVSDHRGSLVSEATFGGAVAAVAGALGLGALGISKTEHDAVRSTPQSIPTATMSSPATQAASTKKTVAEEMLGTTSPVSPPKDATTGSSITNVSDFYSMHVPVAISPSPGTNQASPTTPTASKGSNYFPITPKSAQNRTQAVETTPPRQTDGAADSSHEKLRPAPLRTASGRASSARPTTVDGGPKSTPPTLHDIVTLPAKGSDTSPSTSKAPITSSRPESSGPATIGAISTVVPPRGPSKGNQQTKHVKVDSRGSVTSPHSRNSSSGTRPLGIAKDMSVRPQSASQQRPIGTITDETSSTLNISRDVRPSTSNSSTSKRFLGKALQLGDESDEAKKKSLEILIRGNETLHYTLTPAAALRDESTTQRNRPPTQDMSEFLRSTEPAIDPTTRGKQGGLNSNPPEPPSSPRILQRIVTPSSPKGVVTPASPTRAKNPLGEPRDARADSTSSTRDLADYARSTGPSDVKQLPQSIGPRAVPISPRPGSATLRTEPASPTTSKPANRLKYQARDARPIQRDETAELIDFIREGPPYPEKEHRIDRKVAPFRTTMDSEDFNNLAGGREVVASLRESEDGQPVPSVDPSITSQTPLILSNGQGAKGAVPAAATRQNDIDEDGMPKKTRRRIKDPYAIYDSDDEDFEYEMGSKSNKQEESLIDFLRNTAPPPGMTTQPILTTRPGQRSLEQIRTDGPREESPHLTQTGSKLDKYRPTQPTHAAHIDRARSTHTRNLDRNRPKSRFEARDAKATRTDTAELAEYLKSSGPAPNTEYRPQPFILSSNTPPKQPTIQTLPPPLPKDDGSLFKRFSKRKK